MFRVLTCLTTQHDWRLVVVAGVVCYLASLTAIMLFNRARATAGRARTIWIAAAGTATGCGIWATHFLAMLAYNPGVPIAYDINLTTLSLVVAVTITTGGLAVAVLIPTRWGAAIGGGVIGAGVACMHYLGMFAVELPGRVAWDFPLVIASIILGMVLGMAALAVAVRWRGLRALWASALLLTLAIVSHHFTAMGAVEIIPDPTRSFTELSLSPASLAITVASVAVAILGMSIISAFADRRLDDKARLLGIALNNMTQGVVMFDASGRLVVSNEQYVAMYGLSAAIVKPGAALVDIVRHRFETGSLHRDPAQYCAELAASMAAGEVVSFVTEAPDGRAISVVNRAIPGGTFWVGTHDDITERRKAERKSASLGEQEARRAVIDEAIAWFRESVEGVLKTVADGVGAMKTTAAALSATANETTAHTAGAVQTSSQAFDSVEVASTAAEEMSKSIAEINHQLARATDVVRAATAQAQSTNADIADLAQAAQKIDDVIKLIHSVAGQTNLLALNATIEAARAGVAGKGFAVVASEVKALAVQTAKATDVIASQIAAVQSSTQSAVHAIGNISGRVQDIQQFTAAIASAVEQQHASTSQISSNVATAAAGTKSVVAVLRRVATAISDMRSSADTVLTASQSVEQAAENLRGSVDGFLRKVAI
ncbi:MAG TPA: MHYT domain-containing protein [Xanthobacteraceae bacterium]|nr:MHYT domain-containing protein [Xanthobacteraceae bacterium]